MTEKFNLDTQSFAYEGDFKLLDKIFENILLKYLKRLGIIDNLIENKEELQNLLKEINNVIDETNRQTKIDKRMPELTMGQLEFMLKQSKNQSLLTAMQ
jgi:hypothetical protein